MRLALAFALGFVAAVFALTLPDASGARHL